MAEWIKNIFVSIFGSNSALATFIISMVPIVELRGAIPFGSASSFWGENALPLWLSFIVSVLGSSLICVILTFAFQPLFQFLKRTKLFKKLAGFVEAKLTKKSEKINNKTAGESDNGKILKVKLLGVFSFVAIPLPLTGVWTGTCLALFIGLSKKQTLFTVILGNFLAGEIITVISVFFGNKTIYVLYAFLILLAIFVIYGVISAIIKKFRKKGEVSAAKGEDAQN